MATSLRIREPDDGSYLLYSAEDAEALGAHAMMNMLYLHHRKESDTRERRYH